MRAALGNSLARLIAWGLLPFLAGCMMAPPPNGAARQAGSEPAANGLYFLTGPRDETVRKDRYGGALRSWCAPGPAIREALVYSVTNDNSRFDFVLKTAAFDWDPSVEYRRDRVDAALLLDGRWFRLGIVEQGKDESRLKTSVGAKDARFLAKHFGVTARKRLNPGYRLTGTFKPEKDRYTAGDNVKLIFTLTNRGTIPVAFMKTVKPSGNWDGDFGCKITLNGQSAEKQSPVARGGLFTYVHLQPGQSDHSVLDLAAYTDFEEPGTYNIECYAGLRLFSPDAKTPLEETSPGRWDEGITQTIRIKVLPKASEQK